MFLKLQSAISLFTCSCLVSFAASPANVGILVTNGSAQVDGTAIHGNSTLFQGSEVKAGEISSDLRFTDGSTLVLQPGATVKVYRDHSELKQGTVMQRGASGHTLIADDLKISSLSADGTVLVGVKDSSHLEAVAQNAPAEVRTPTGNLIARLEPGQPLNFTIKAISADGAAALPPDGGGQAGGAAPAATGPVWTAGSITFLAVVAAGGTLLGLAAAGKLSSGPSVSTP
jgi:hypothetical protein